MTTPRCSNPGWPTRAWRPRSIPTRTERTRPSTSRALCHPGTTAPSDAGCRSSRWPVRYRCWSGSSPSPTAARPRWSSPASCSSSSSAAALLMPWRRLPGWAWPVIPIGFIGSHRSHPRRPGERLGPGALYVLPIVWLAFYGKRSQLVLGVAAVIGAARRAPAGGGGARVPCLAVAPRPRHLGGGRAGLVLVLHHGRPGPGVRREPRPAFATGPAERPVRPSRRASSWTPCCGRPPRRRSSAPTRTG